MPFFTNCQIEIFEYAETAETDEDNEPLIEYVYKDSIPADIQPHTLNSTRGGDNQLESGKIITDLYKIYLDKNVEITDKAILRVKGKEDTYVILGSPQYNEHGLGIGHLKLNVQKERKPTKLPTVDD